MVTWSQQPRYKSYLQQVTEDRLWHLEPQGVLHPVGHRRQGQRLGQCPLWNTTPSQKLPQVSSLGPRSADRPACFTSGHKSQTVPTPGSSGSRGYPPLLVHSQGQGGAVPTAGGFVKLHHVAGG